MTDKESSGDKQITQHPYRASLVAAQKELADLEAKLEANSETIKAVDEELRIVSEKKDEAEAGTILSGEPPRSCELYDQRIEVSLR